MRAKTTTASASAAPLSQRREDYRLEVPVEDEVTCTFKFARKFERQPYSVTLEVRDISAGGLTVADYDKRLLDVVESIVNACELRLPNHHRSLYVNLKVLRAQEDALANRHAVTRLSCQFVNLSDAASLTIRRYISALERRQIARVRGLD